MHKNVQCRLSKPIRNAAWLRLLLYGYCMLASRKAYPQHLSNCKAGMAVYGREKGQRVQERSNRITILDNRIRIGANADSGQTD